MEAAETAGWLARAIETAPDFAVILLDPQGSIASWPGGAKNVFGYEADEVIGQPLTVLFTPEDQAAEASLHEMTTAERVGQAHDDRWHVRKDGSRFWVSGVAQALRDEHGRLMGFAKLMRDRTDLRAELDLLANRLHTSNQECARQHTIAATLAHELRNPMAPIANAVQLIRIAAPHGNPAFDYPLRVIERQLAFMQRMVDDMMDMERMRLGKLQLAFTRTTLQSALEESVRWMQPSAEARRIHLEGVYPPQPVDIDLDPDRFQQLMVNLLTNAVKFTPPGGRIWVKATVETKSATIRVEDTGVGISPDLQPRLFELFTQGEVSRGRDTGLGIGLALVKSLVALHHGTITLRSEGAGKGSEFTVRLPLSQQSSSDTSAEQRDQPSQF